MPYGTHSLYDTYFKVYLQTIFSFSEGLCTSVLPVLAVEGKVCLLAVCCVWS